MKELSHEDHILKLVDMDFITKGTVIEEDDRTGRKTVLQDREIIISELATQGDLFDYITENEPMIKDEPTLKKFVGDICRGLQALHQHGYCHLDLKPENLLINKEKGI